jgi:hypothetical protein
MVDMARRNSSRRVFLKKMAASTVAGVTVGLARPSPAWAAEASVRDHAGTSRVQEAGCAFAISAQNPVVIVTVQDDALARLAAERLVHYIQRVTGTTPQVIVRDRLSSLSTRHGAIVFEKDNLPNCRVDGYQIRTGEVGGRMLVSIRAPGSAGLKYGAYRLIREIVQRGDSICVPPLAIQANPWLKTRELFIADLSWNPTPGEKPHLKDLHTRFDWLNWDMPRLERYVDLADAMGYNSLMLMDPDLMALWTGGFNDTAEENRKKVQGMLRRARQNGMGTAFFLWGQEGAKDILAARNCPRIPEQLADMEAHWRNVIECYGALVDRWLLHWADPGGCKLRDCTIETPQVMTNQFARMLRQQGFASDVSFSLWALRWGADPKSRPWPGYIDWTSVVESGVLAPEIGITDPALNGCNVSGGSCI